MRISDWSSDVCSSGFPLPASRLKGRFPLKLLGVPADPVPGDARAGTAIRAGHFLHRGLKLPLGELDFAALNVAPTFADYLHSFAWLRDLAATGTRADGVPIAEAVVRHWLGPHGDRKSVVWGKSVPVGGVHGGRRSIKRSKNE